MTVNEAIQAFREADEKYRQACAKWEELAKMYNQAEEESEAAGHACVKAQEALINTIREARQ